MSVITDKIAERLAPKRPLSKLMPGIADSTVLQYIATEKTQQGVRASLSVATYTKKYSRVGKAFHHYFKRWGCATSFIIVTRLVHIILTTQKKASVMTSVPTSTMTEADTLCLTHFFVVEDLFVSK